MKILYVSTILGTMNFFKDEFKHLQEKGVEIHLACNTTSSKSANFKGPELKMFNLPFSRKPLSKSNYSAYLKLREILKTNQYDIIHCHTPVASAITRFASRDVRKKGTKVVYTAHGFHFYKGAPLRNWLVYYPVEWICSHWTDTLITINREDYLLAKNNMKAKEVVYVPGVGINLEELTSVKINKEDKRNSLDIPLKATVILSVGELSARKNHETVIRAIEGMDVYYLIAGKGNKESYLKEVAKEVGMENRVKLLGFRTDISELLQISDLFVFPSFQEGLPVSLMEAMAFGKPAVVSEIRGNVDLIDQNGGLFFNPNSSDECRKAIAKLLCSDMEQMGNYNKRKVINYSEEIIFEKLDFLYFQDF